MNHYSVIVTDQYTGAVMTISVQADCEEGAEWAAKERGYIVHQGTASLEDE